MKEIKRIGPVSVGKISAVIGAVVGVIAGLVLAMFSGPLGGAFLGGNWFVQLIGLTVIYTVAAFVGGVVYAAIYNLVAGWVGGIQIELDDA